MHVLAQNKTVLVGNIYKFHHRPPPELNWVFDMQLYHSTMNDAMHPASSTVY